MRRKASHVRTVCGESNQDKRFLASRKRDDSHAAVGSPRHFGLRRLPCVSRCHSAAIKPSGLTGLRIQYTPNGSLTAQIQRAFQRTSRAVRAHNTSSRSENTPDPQCSPILRRPDPSSSLGPPSVRPSIADGKWAEPTKGTTRTTMRRSSGMLEEEEEEEEEEVSSHLLPLFSSWRVIILYSFNGHYSTAALVICTQENTS